MCNHDTFFNCFIINILLILIYTFDFFEFYVHFVNVSNIKEFGEDKVILHVYIEYYRKVVLVKK